MIGQKILFDAYPLMQDYYCHSGVINLRDWQEMIRQAVDAVFNQTSVLDKTRLQIGYRLIGDTTESLQYEALFARMLDFFRSEFTYYGFIDRYGKAANGDYVVSGFVFRDGKSLVLLSNLGVQ